MTRSRWVAATVSIALILAGLLWQIWPRETRPVEQQVTDTLDELADAARRGRVDEIMGFISSDFRAGAINRTQLRLLLIRSRRNARVGDYDVKLNRPTLLPADPGKPDQRMVLGKLAVFDSFGGETLWGADSMVFVLRREPDRKWGVFPTHRWRVLGVPNLPPLPIGGD
jgi:hypothetical protein